MRGKLIYSDLLGTQSTFPEEEYQSWFWKQSEQTKVQTTWGAGMAKEVWGKSAMKGKVDLFKVGLKIQSVLSYELWSIFMMYGISQVRAKIEC